MTKSTNIPIPSIREVLLNKKCIIWSIISLMWAQLAAKSLSRARNPILSRRKVLGMKALKRWLALLGYLNMDQVKSMKGSYLTEKDPEKEKWLFQMVINILETGDLIKCVIMMVSITLEMEMNTKASTNTFPINIMCLTVMDSSK